MNISRRTFLTGTAALAGSSFLGIGCSSSGSHGPSGTQLSLLFDRVGDKLIAPTSPLQPCFADSGSTECALALEQMHNPFALEANPGATQTQGWLNAWTTQVSPYAVAATSAADVAAAVDFARDNRIKLTVKGTGHDYLGRNNAANSLLVWTHNMRDVNYDDNFIPQGSSGPGYPAITVEAGTRWIEAYRAATEVGRYVQGGGCTSVGASGGFIQGSGFGSFSKQFGTGAGGVLEFEVVTADGKVRIANAFQNQDLFWALRGGGGGTFGIVTKTTLLAHPIPQTMGVCAGHITASNDAAFERLLQRFCMFLPELINPNWGEQIRVRAENSLDVAMVFLELSEGQARATWRPLLDWVAEQGHELRAELEFKTLAFSDQWNADYWDRTNPGFITHDPSPNAPEWRYWWTGNSGETSWFIAEYQSCWLSMALANDPQRLARLFYEASRVRDFIVQTNKGLAGQSEEAFRRDSMTSLHPAAFEAAALILVVDAVQNAYPGVDGLEPDLKDLKRRRDRVNAAMEVFNEAMPNAGAYANEASYFQPDWQNAFWGSNYDRLLQVKREVDPGNLFRVHHGVGSEY